MQLKSIKWFIQTWQVTVYKSELFQMLSMTECEHVGCCGWGGGDQWPVTRWQWPGPGTGAGAGVRRSPACPGTGRHSVRYWHQSGAERLHMSQIQEAWIMNDSQIYKNTKWYYLILMENLTVIWENTNTIYQMLDILQKSCSAIWIKLNSFN